MTHFQDELDTSAQRESEIVREALRHYPTLQAAPDFDARVLERLQNAPFSQRTAQHSWKDAAPTRRALWRLWFARRVLRLENAVRHAPRATIFLLVAIAFLLLIIVLRATIHNSQWARTSETQSNTQRESRPRNAESSPVFGMPRNDLMRDNSAR